MAQVLENKSFMKILNSESNSDGSFPVSFRTWVLGVCWPELYAGRGGCRMTSLTPDSSAVRVEILSLPHPLHTHATALPTALVPSWKPRTPREVSTGLKGSLLPAWPADIASVTCRGRASNAWRRSAEPHRFIWKAWLNSELLFKWCVFLINRWKVWSYREKSKWYFSIKHATKQAPTLKEVGNPALGLEVRPPFSFTSCAVFHFLS